MNVRITRSALRAFAVLAALFVTAFATPALAQFEGDVEGRRFDVIADPGGANVHFATVWFGQGESIWRAEDKVDEADLQAGVDLVDKGLEKVPTGLFTSYTSTTLTGNNTYYTTHEFIRSSDSQVDFVFDFKLESSCTTNCLLTALTYLTVDDLETDLENPSSSTYALDYTSSFVGVSGDHVESHNPH